MTAALLAAGSLLAPTAHAAATCGTTTAADEWPTFGRDVANSRTQSAAGDISPDSVHNLTPSWTYSTGAGAGSGDLNGTPIVSGGCVFINTASGHIVALDAGTGAVVWEHHVDIPVADTGLGSGVFISSPVVDPVTQRLYALVSRSGRPSVIALDLADGRVRGEHTIIEGNGYYTQATPVIAGRVLIVGFSPVEGDPNERGGVTLFRLPSSARSSAPWHSTVVYTIPDADFQNPPHYAGGGIWTAPAVDLDNGYAYAGTSNPYSKKVEHENTNAILKIDVDPSRDTYGTIIGSYKGLIEQYDENVRDIDQPVCDTTGEEDLSQEPVGDSTTCLQLDLDFGASPNLFHASDGTLLVGDLQKAGVYHAARADTMAGVWKSTVGGSCAACNAAAWAFDGSPIGVSSPGTTMFSLSKDDGSPQWASPVADGTHYQSTSIAGGVVFTVDNYGNLVAFDEATGLPIAKRPIALDTSGTAGPALTSAGVAIARGRIYAAAGNTVVAYSPAAAPVALP
jgi:outer membrane protein assembly factor BamB